MRFSIVIENKLTEKQAQKLSTMKTIISALYQDDKKHPRTVKELKKITRLSSGILSKHLRELVKAGAINGFVKVQANRLTVFYEHDDSVFIKVVGRACEKIKEGDRFKQCDTRAYDANGLITGRKTSVQHGHFAPGKMKKNKKKSNRFYASSSEIRIR